MPPRIELSKYPKRITINDPEPKSEAIQLDSADRIIIQELIGNCRVTYQTLSTKLGMTANAAKNRVQRLVDNGVIEAFVATLSLRVIGAEPFMAFVSVKDSKDEETFMQQVGSNPMVTSVRLDSVGWWVIRGEYVKAKGLAELSSFLWGFDGVTSAEVHPMPCEGGSTPKLSNYHLKVLRALVDDPRAPASQIAKVTGLTTRRVRRGIEEMTESGAVELTTRVNFNAGGSTMFVARVVWDPKQVDANQITSRLHERFPITFWRADVSAVRPLLWAFFVLDHMAQSEEIVRRVKEIPSAQTAGTVVSYRARVFPGLRHIYLNSMFAEAGIPQVEKWIDRKPGEM